jgi:ElaB/YqjD/DUF883 family membrane-anchored ribosome-binding protein
MDRTQTYTQPGMSGSLTGNLPNSVNAGVESAASTAHKVTDRIADTATSQVDRLSGTAHRAVNSAAEAATSAVQQVQQAQTRLTEAACSSIRAKPLQTVAGALAIGFLLGRLARL